jgi:hypothetical protein
MLFAFALPSNLSAVPFAPRDNFPLSLTEIRNRSFCLLTSEI